MLNGKPSTIYISDVCQKPKNKKYQTTAIIHDLSDLEEATCFDSITAECTNSERAKSNYLGDNMLVMDCDNTHSDDPDDWYDPNHVAEKFPNVGFYSIYSRNHMKPKKMNNGITQEPRPKFHLYFPLKNRETDYEEAMRLRKKVLCLFPAFDGKCSDPVHMMYGVPGAHGEAYAGSVYLDEFIAGYDAECPEIYRERVSKFYDMISDPDEKERLAPLFEFLDMPISKTKTDSTVSEASENTKDQEQWLEEFFLKHQIKYEKVIAGKVIQYRVMCPWHDSHTSGDDIALVSIVNSKIGYVCHHDHCRGKHWSDYRRYFEPDFDSPAKMGKWYYTIKNKDEKEVIVDYKFAEYLQEILSVKRISQQLHIFRDGYFKTGYRFIENEIYKREPYLKANRRTEVIKYLEVLNPGNTEPSEKDTDYIYCDDKYINWKTGVICEPTPDIIIQNRIPFAYDPEAYYEPLDKAVDAWCMDQECRDLLLEAVGSCLYRSARLQESFILVGYGANGKSTFLNCLKKMLGDENISQLDIAELSGKNSSASLVSKLANIGDDISSDYLQGIQVSMFKKVVTGNGIRAEKKYQDEFFFEPYAKLFFSANDIPRMSSDSQKSISRRLIIIPFDADFSGETADKDIEDQLLSSDSMKYLLKLAVEGLKRVMTNGFTVCSRVSEKKKEYERDNNPVLAWAEEIKAEKDYDQKQLIEYFTTEYSVSDLYDQYKEYLITNGTKDRFIPNCNMFSKKIHEAFDLDSCRVYRAGRRGMYFKAKNADTSTAGDEPEAIPFI